jgi:hypothetical protein
MSTLAKLESMRERWFVASYAGLLLAALLIVYRNFVFSGLMFLSYDVVQYGMWQATLLRDFLVSAHTIPLWNPYILCGLPYVESIHGGIFYPLSYLDYLGYLPRMIGFNFLFHFWLAGLFAYFAARQFKLSRISAAVVGVAYAFSPLVLSWIGPGHEGKIYCATFFPLLMLFLDQMFERDGYLPILLTGLVYGIIIVTPHLQVAYYIAWCIGGFTLYQSILLWRDRTGLPAILKRVGKVAAAVGLALLLSAVQWLPSSNYIVKYSPRSVEERGATFAANFSMHVEEVVALAVPDFCGIDELPYARTYWGRNSFRDNSESPGGIVLFLAIIGAVLAGWRRKGFWLISVLIILIYALGATTPLFSLLVAVIPLLDSMRAPTTAMFMAIFGIAMLAGLGVDQILERTNEGVPGLSRTAKRLLIAAPLVSVIVAIACSILGGRLFTLYAKTLYPALLEAGNLKWGYAQTNLPHLLTGLWVVAAGVALVCALVLWVQRTPANRAALLGLVPLILIANGMFVQRGMLLGDPKPLYEQNAISRYLVSHCKQDRAMPLNISVNEVKIGFQGIPSQVGFHSRGLLWFYQMIGGPGAPYYKDPRLFNLAGVRYIVGAVGRQSVLVELQIPVDTILVEGDHVLYENKAAFPRTFLVDRYMVAPNFAAIMEEVRFGRTDLRHKAILEERGTLPILPANDLTADAAISYYSPDSVEVAVRTSTPQLLILTDNWHPSWHAYVDGVESTIHRAYGCFRAVELPGGSRKVAFVYRSPLFTIGKYLSLLGLVMLGGGIGMIGWRRRDGTLPGSKGKATPK